MLMKAGSRVVVALTGLIITPLALAHPVPAETVGLVSGLVHPFTGMDHILAALAAGLWGAVLGGARSRSVVAAFLGMLGLGAITGLVGASMPMVEPVIALSVIAFGVLIALRLTLPGIVASAVAGGFAFFHGYAHATGLPLTAASGWYLLGVLAGTTVLLGSGVALGRWLLDSQSRVGLQLAGGLFALVGSLLLAYS